MAKHLDIVELAPESLAEVNDTFSGQRKLVLVTDSGKGYVDLSDDEASVFPLYAVLDPVAAGDPQFWLIEAAAADEADGVRFEQLAQRILASSEDYLTCLRALRWATVHRSLNEQAALEAAREQAELIRRSRARMDGVLGRIAKGVA